MSRDPRSCKTCAVVKPDIAGHPFLIPTSPEHAWRLWFHEGTEPVDVETRILQHPIIGQWARGNAIREAMRTKVRASAFGWNPFVVDVHLHLLALYYEASLAERDAAIADPWMGDEWFCDACDEYHPDDVPTGITSGGWTFCPKHTP